MKSSILLIRLGGVFNLLIAVLHMFFWKLFDWPAELVKLNVDNSNIMQMLNLFTIVFLLYSAILLIYRPADFISDGIGRAFVRMLATMYIARLAMEFYFPNGSLEFAAFLLIACMLFIIPLFKTKKTKYANQ